MGTFLAPLVLAAASATQPPGVTGVRTEIVRLDVAVLDAQGKPVRGLAPSDFVVLEDGKKQQVTNFFEVAGDRAPGADAAEKPAPVPEGATGRAILVVVDDLHLAADGLDLAIQALRRMIDDLGPDDRVALVATSGSGNLPWLTTERAVLRQALGRIVVREAAVAPATQSQMTPAQAELILSGDTSALQLAARVMVGDASGGFAELTPRAALEGRSGGAQGTGLEDPRERAAAQEARRQAVPILNEALRYSVASLNVTQQAIRRLAGFPGRKVCLFVSHGFLVGARTTEERTRDLQAVVDAAMRSEAIVYTLDPQGLGGEAPAAGSPSAPGAPSRIQHQTETLYRSTLTKLADDGGGYLIPAGDDPAIRVRRALADEPVYTMAYEPANAKRDGRFRRVDVRVARHSDYAVRTRRGYFAPGGGKESPTSAALFPAMFALTEDEGRAALAAPVPAKGIPVRLTADYLELPGAGPTSILGIHVDVASLRFQSSGGRRQADLEIVGGFYDPGGNPVGNVVGTRKALDLTAAEYERVKQEGLDYRQQTGVAPGRYEVRLVVRETRLGQIGGARRSVEIPDLKTSALAMSGVFVSSSAEAAPSRPPAATTFENVHVSDRFRPGGSLHFQLYVYNPARAADGTSDVILQAQILSRGKVLAASKPRPAALEERGGLPLPETNELTLQDVGPGDYELRVVVVDRRAGATVFRDVDFVVGE